MTGSQMREIRRRLKMEREEFARLIGYTGTDRNNASRVKRLENNEPGSPVPLYIARLLWMIECVLHRQGGVPIVYKGPGFAIDWPDWPGYEFDHTPDPQHQKEAM